MHDVAVVGRDGMHRVGGVPADGTDGIALAAEIRRLVARDHIGMLPRLPDSVAGTGRAQKALTHTSIV